MVTNDGLGSCLPGSGERCSSPISCPPNERPGEFGDGDLPNSALEHIQLNAQPHTQLSAQLHTLSLNAGSSNVLNTQHDRPNTPSAGGEEPHIGFTEHSLTTTQPQPQNAQLCTSNPNADTQTIPNPQQNGLGTPPQDHTVLPQVAADGKGKKKKKIKKNTRASLKIASLNIRGRGPSGDSKWDHINQVMKEQRLGVLAVQEAHLTQSHVDSLHTLFGKRLQIHSSQGPNANAQGVAIVLNKELTNIKGVEEQEIIPGRAMLITLPWHSDLSLRILNIYAPNAHSENQTFWEALDSEWMSQGLPAPDIMLGDFNIVEDAIDRLPSHTDPYTTVTSLDNLRNKFQLQDGWRTTYPETKSFSFLQKSTGAQSRIDRIYTTMNIIKTAADWEINTTALNTDHKMVSMKVIDQKAPYFGRGRWTMPLHMLKDNSLIKEIQGIGRELEQQMDGEHQRTQVANPQVHFQTFKNKIVVLTRARAKVTATKTNQRIVHAQEECKNLLNSESVDSIETQLSLGLLEERIAQLETLRYKKARTATAAHDRLEGETISKYWSEVNKSKTPRDAIYALEKPNTNPIIYETKSKNMAELARNYHHHLLQAGLNTPPEERENIIMDVLNAVLPEDTLPNANKATMGNQLSEQEVLEALKSSKNGTSTGVNGLPYELWKILNDKYEVESKTNKPTFNIIKALTRVFNDIEEHEVVSTTKFAEGWMCPLYKKKDKRQIANYRPITILNSDYKIFTKALAVKLAKIVPKIIQCIGTTLDTTLGLPLLHWPQTQIHEFVSIGHLCNILECLNLFYHGLL